MIIVTGATGFIGSNLLAGLEEHGVGPLVACDWLGSEDKWRNLAKRDLWDVVRPDDLIDYMRPYKDRVTAIFHMGANSATTERDGDRIIAENIRPTLDLIDWCTANGTRLIYASSAATYGDGKAGFDDDASPQSLARLRPLNLYGWSKHMVDRRIAGMRRDGLDLPSQLVGLKFFNVYGPNELHKGDMMSVVSKLTPKLRAGEPARLFKSYREDYPDGGQKRDFVHVDDVVSVMLWLFDNPSVGGLFNVGAGLARTWDDLAKAVFAALGKAPVIEYVDMPESLRPKYQYWTEAPLARLRAAGYGGNMISLEEGVARLVQDHLVQDDPYR